MLKNLMTGAAALALSVAAMAGSANAGLIIDSFTTGLGGAINIEDDGAVGDLSVFRRNTTGGSDIIGGDREVTVTNTGLQGDIVSVNIATGSYRHNNGSGSGTSLVIWDGAGGGDGLDFGLTDGAGGIDLSAAGQYFHLTVIAADLTGSSMSLTLYTNGGQWSRGTVPIPVVNVIPLGNSPFEFYLSMAAVAAGIGGATSGGGVDLTDVTAIEWFADGSDSFDLRVDIVEVVPEPASLTLLGAGLMGLGYFGKRRKA